MASGYLIGQRRYRTSPLLQKVLLDNTAPKEDTDRTGRAGYKWKAHFRVSPKEKDELSCIDSVLTARCEQLSLARVHALVCVSPGVDMPLLKEAGAWRIILLEEDCCNSPIWKGAINV